jgi:hypothetical protein
MLDFTAEWNEMTTSEIRAEHRLFMKELRKRSITPTLRASLAAHVVVMERIIRERQERDAAIINQELANEEGN